MKLGSEFNYGLLGNILSDDLYGYNVEQLDGEFGEGFRRFSVSRQDDNKRLHFDVRAGYANPFGAQSDNDNQVISTGYSYEVRTKGESVFHVGSLAHVTGTKPEDVSTSSPEKHLSNAIQATFDTGDQRGGNAGPSYAQYFSSTLTAGNDEYNLPGGIPLSRLSSPEGARRHRGSMVMVHYDAGVAHQQSEANGALRQWLSGSDDSLALTGYVMRKPDRGIVGGDQDWPGSRVALEPVSRDVSDGDLRTVLSMRNGGAGKVPGDIKHLTTYGGGMGGTRETAFPLTAAGGRQVPLQAGTRDQWHRPAGGDYVQLGYIEEGESSPRSALATRGLIGPSPIHPGAAVVDPRMFPNVSGFGERGVQQVALPFERPSQMMAEGAFDFGSSVAGQRIQGGGGGTTFGTAQVDGKEFSIGAGSRPYDFSVEEGRMMIPSFYNPVQDTFSAVPGRGYISTREAHPRTGAPSYADRLQEKLSPFGINVDASGSGDPYMQLHGFGHVGASGKGGVGMKAGFTLSGSQRPITMNVGGKDMRLGLVTGEAKQISEVMKGSWGLQRFDQQVEMLNMVDPRLGASIESHYTGEYGDKRPPIELDRVARTYSDLQGKPRTSGEVFNAMYGKFMGASPKQNLQNIQNYNFGYNPENQYITANVVSGTEKRALQSAAKEIYPTIKRGNRADRTAATMEKLNDPQFAVGDVLSGREKKNIANLFANAGPRGLDNIFKFSPVEGSDDLHDFSYMLPKGMGVVGDIATPLVPEYPARFQANYETIGALNARYPEASKAMGLAPDQGPNAGTASPSRQAWVSASQAHMLDLSSAGDGYTGTTANGVNEVTPAKAEAMRAALPPEMFASGDDVPVDEERATQFSDAMREVFGEGAENRPYHFTETGHFLPSMETGVGLEAWDSATEIGQRSSLSRYSTKLLRAYQSGIEASTMGPDANPAEKEVATRGLNRWRETMGEQFTSKGTVGKLIGRDVPGIGGRFTVMSGLEKSEAYFTKGTVGRIAREIGASPQALTDYVNEQRGGKLPGVFMRYPTVSRRWGAMAVEAQINPKNLREGLIAPVDPILSRLGEHLPGRMANPFGAGKMHISQLMSENFIGDEDDDPYAFISMIGYDKDSGQFLDYTSLDPNFSQDIKSQDSAMGALEKMFGGRADEFSILKSTVGEFLQGKSPVRTNLDMKRVPLGEMLDQAEIHMGGKATMGRAYNLRRRFEAAAASTGRTGQGFNKFFERSGLMYQEPLDFLRYTANTVEAAYSSMQIKPRKHSKDTGGAPATRKSWSVGANISDSGGMTWSSLSSSSDNPETPAFAKGLFNVMASAKDNKGNHYFTPENVGWMFGGDEESAKKITNLMSDADAGDRGRSLAMIESGQANELLSDMSPASVAAASAVVENTRRASKKDGNAMQGEFANAEIPFAGKMRTLNEIGKIPEVANTTSSYGLLTKAKVTSAERLSMMAQTMPEGSLWHGMIKGLGIATGLLDEEGQPFNPVKLDTFQRMVSDGKERIVQEQAKARSVARGEHLRPAQVEHVNNALNSVAPVPAPGGGSTGGSIPPSGGSAPAASAADFGPSGGGGGGGNMTNNIYTNTVSYPESKRNATLLMSDLQKGEYAGALLNKEFLSGDLVPKLQDAVSSVIPGEQGESLRSHLQRAIMSDQGAEKVTHALQPYSGQLKRMGNLTRKVATGLTAMGNSRLPIDRRTAEFKKEFPALSALNAEGGDFGNFVADVSGIAGTLGDGKAVGQTAAQSVAVSALQGEMMKPGGMIEQFTAQTNMSLGELTVPSTMIEDYDPANMQKGMDMLSGQFRPLVQRAAGLVGSMGGLADLPPEIMALGTFGKQMGYRAVKPGTAISASQSSRVRKAGMVSAATVGQHGQRALDAMSPEFMSQFMSADEIGRGDLMRTNPDVLAAVRTFQTNLLNSEVDPGAVDPLLSQAMVGAKQVRGSGKRATPPEALTSVGDIDDRMKGFREAIDAATGSMKKLQKVQSEYTTETSKGRDALMKANDEHERNVARVQRADIGIKRGAVSDEMGVLREKGSLTQKESLRMQKLFGDDFDLEMKESALQERIDAPPPQPQGANWNKFMHNLVGGWGLFYLGSVAKLGMGQASQGYQERQAYEEGLAAQTGEYFGTGTIRDRYSLETAHNNALIRSGGTTMAGLRQAGIPLIGSAASDIAGSALTGMGMTAGMLHIAGSAQAVAPNIAGTLGKYAPAVGVAAAGGMAVASLWGYGQNIESSKAQVSGHLARAYTNPGSFGSGLEEITAAWKSVGMSMFGGAEGNAAIQDAEEYASIAASLFDESLPGDFAMGFSDDTKLGVAQSLASLDFFAGRFDQGKAASVISRLQDTPLYSNVNAENILLADKAGIDLTASASAMHTLRTGQVPTLQNIMPSIVNMSELALSSEGAETIQKLPGGFSVLASGGMWSLREAQGFSQEQVAGYADVSSSPYADIFAKEMGLYSAKKSLGLDATLPSSDMTFFEMMPDDVMVAYQDQIAKEEAFVGRATGFAQQGRAMGMSPADARAMGTRYAGSDVNQRAMYEGVAGRSRNAIAAMVSTGYNAGDIAGAQQFSPYVTTDMRMTDGQLTPTGLPLFTSSLWHGAKSPETMAQQIWGASPGQYSPYQKAVVDGYTPMFGSGKSYSGTQGGSFYMADLQYESSMASAGIAMAQQNLSFAFTTGVGIEDYSGIVNPQTGDPFGFNTGQFSWSVNGDRFKSTGGGFWGMQDATRALSHSQQNWNFDFQREQIAMNQRHFGENMALTTEQTALNRDYSRNNWAYQDQTRGLQWEWANEDFEENIRFMTGRQRRLAERKHERDTTMHGLEGNQIDAQRAHQEELWRLEDDRFQLQKDHYAESIKSQEKQIKVSERYYKERKKLEEEQVKLQRAYQTEQMALQKAAIGAQAYYAQKIHEASTQQKELALAQDEITASAGVNLELNRQVGGDMLGWLERVERKIQGMIIPGGGGGGGGNDDDGGDEETGDTEGAFIPFASPTFSDPRSSTYISDTNDSSVMSSGPETITVNVVLDNDILGTFVIDTVKGELA